MREKASNFSFQALTIFFLLFALSASSQEKDTLSQKTDSTSLVSRAGNYLSMNWDQLRLLPFRNIQTFGLVSPGTYKTKYDKMYFYGIRSDENQYYVDGMQVRNIEHFPLRLINKYEIYSSQAPIELGFSNAAIGNIETLNTFDEFKIIADLNGDLANSMGSFNAELIFAIPLVGKKKNSNKPFPLLIISGKYYQTNNDDPIWKQIPNLNAERREALFDHPLRQSENWTHTELNAEYVLEKDFTSQPPPSFQGSHGFYPYLRLNIPIGTNKELSFVGYGQITGKDVYDFDNSVFNADQNTIQTQRNFDTYVQWKQNLLFNKELSIDYQLGFQYSTYYLKNESRQHENQFFDYGYVGKFETYKTPTFEIGNDSVNGEYYESVWLLNSWDYDTLVEYTPSGINRGLSNYTSDYYDIFEFTPQGKFQNLDQISLGGGLINGEMPSSVYGLYNNTATNSSIYHENADQRIRTSLQMNINFKAHQLSIGGEYNSESKSSYALEPAGLWSLMRGLTNFHLHELDIDNPIALENNGTVDTIIYKRFYNGDAQRNFDVELRKALGLAVDGLDYILIDSYDPGKNTISYYDEYGNQKTIKTPSNLLELQLFSAEELLNYGYSYASYRGYDYKGNKLSKKNDPYSFYENYTISATNHTFWAAYIQDEFNWKDLHVRVGLRIDVFNSKRPVLHDIYSLFPVFNVKEVKNSAELKFEQPSNISDDYLVYTDNSVNPDYVTGFRDGDKWYDSNGTEISDPDILNVGNGVSPYLKYPDIKTVGEEEWTPEMTFQNTKPSVSILPHIKIDYTILKRINIYTSYHSFSQNPSIINDYRPEYYAYWSSIISNQIIPNPLIKPMRTGKLFAGIKGFIWKNLLADISYLSIFIDNYFALKFVRGGYPADYFTYANSDKRISTNGLKLNLDFINPNSSGAFGGVSFVKLFPDENDLNFRYTSDAVLNTYLGYRFGNQPGYSGPAWGNNKVLRGLGASIYYQFRRGLPYYYTGSGSGNMEDLRYMPNTNLFNLTIQKDFSFGKMAFLSIYLTIENLFNFKNVFDVYSSTGKADDDGFLSNPANQAYIENQTNPDSFRLLYELKLNNPENFDIPRIWRIGAVFKF